MQWYYTLDGEAQQGPVSPAELKEIIQGGNFGPQGKAWKEGLPDWIPIEKLIAANKSLQPTKPGPPPLPSKPAGLAIEPAIPPVPPPSVSPEANPYSSPDNIPDPPASGPKKKKNRKIKVSQESIDAAADASGWVTTAAWVWGAGVGVNILSSLIQFLFSPRQPGSWIGLVVAIFFMVLIAAIPMFQLMRFSFSLEDFAEEPSPDTIEKTIHQSHLFWKVSILTGVGVILLAIVLTVVAVVVALNMASKPTFQRVPPRPNRPGWRMTTPQVQHRAPLFPLENEKTARRLSTRPVGV